MLTLMSEELYIDFLVTKSNVLFCKYIKIFYFKGKNNRKLLIKYLEINIYKFSCCICPAKKFNSF